MANLKKENGGFKGKNLIVEITKKTEKGAFVVAQVDQSLMNPDKVAAGEHGAKQVPDTNPFINSHKETFKAPDGKDVEFVSHETFYFNSQLDAMRAAAGSKAVEIGGHEVLGIKADLLSTPKNGVIINTKAPMAPTANHRFGKSVLDHQSAVTDAARIYRDASAKARSEAEPVVEEQASVEAQAEEQAEA